MINIHIYFLITSFLTFKSSNNNNSLIQNKIADLQNSQLIANKALLKQAIKTKKICKKRSQKGRLSTNIY